MTLSDTSTKTYSAIQETKIAGALGWDRVTGSGARPTHPGDVRSQDWLGECKTHVNRLPKITFKAADWSKIQEEAMTTFKRPVLFVDDGSQLLEYTWCVFLACDHPGVVVDVPIRSQDFSTRTNLTFGGNYLRKYLYNLTVGQFDDRYFEIHWHGVTIHLARFTQFASWFGESS